MRGRAALLLVLLGALVGPSLQAVHSAGSLPTDSKKPVVGKSSVLDDKSANLSTPASSILDADSVLLQDSKISLDDDGNNKMLQDEVARLIKETARKPLRPRPPVNATPSPKATVSSRPKIPLWKDAYNSTDTKTLEAILRHSDAVFNADNEQQTLDDDGGEYEDDNDAEDNAAADDDDYDDDEDEDGDEDEDEDEDEEDEDEDANEDDGGSECPSHCRCVGEFAEPMTARCSKLSESQSFGSNIGHLQIENAGEIRLGPHALKKVGLKQLETLVIVDTKIVELDPTAFDGLNVLFVVNLTRNGLTYIHPDTFKRNSQLSLLTVSGNPLRLPWRRNSDSVNYIFDAPNVARLDLSNNEFYKLPQGAFDKMPNLANINLKRNRLRTVERELFAPLDQLTELDLSHNLLPKLPKDLFKGLNLQTLKLAGNLLTNLSSIRAPKLTTLDASMNQLKVIAKDDLLGVPYIDRLYLSSNNLRKINAHAFSNLDQLTYLDLSFNNLMDLSDKHLRANSRLQVLLLNENPGLESLPIFRTNTQEFERYSIYRFECENCGLPFIESGTFDAMPAMTKLNLARNQLSLLPSGLLKSLSSLKELDLSMNRIDKLDDDIFDGAESLNKLSLAMNSFVNGLSVTPFLKTPTLSRLDLSYCGLQRIWNNISVPFESLRFLSLKKNLLTHVRIEELRAMPKLSGLDVSRNPLRCDEKLSAAVQWLTDHNVTPIESIHAQQGSLKNQESYENYSEDVSQWTDLAKKICDKWDQGPPARLAARKSNKMSKVDLADAKISMPGPFLTTSQEEILREFGQVELNQGRRTSIDVEFTGDDSDYIDIERHSIEEFDELEAWWKGDKMLPGILLGLMLVGTLLAIAQIAIYLARRRGRGPVIRTPMMLRPGLVDNKNCGLVYKPLQEEIATPHAPKRGSFYSSSTFHYDKIVPESV